MKAGSIRLAAAVVLIVCGLLIVIGRGNQSPEQAGTPAKAGTRAQAGDTAFWQLIGETRDAAGGNTEKQSHLIEARLRELSPRARAKFARTRVGLDRRAYTWDLWARPTRSRTAAQTTASVTFAPT